MAWVKEQHTLSDLFPGRENVLPIYKGSEKKYSSFVDARDLEWAKGDGLRCLVRRSKTEKVKS